MRRKRDYGQCKYNLLYILKCLKWKTDTNLNECEHIFHEKIGTYSEIYSNHYQTIITYKYALIKIYTSKKFQFLGNNCYREKWGEMSAVSPIQDYLSIECDRPVGSHLAEPKSRFIPCNFSSFLNMLRWPVWKDAQLQEGCTQVAVPFFSLDGSNKVLRLPRAEKVQKPEVFGSYWRTCSLLLANKNQP